MSEADSSTALASLITPSSHTCCGGRGVELHPRSATQTGLPQLQSCRENGDGV